MSKKRILSNGYSAHWRDDEPPRPKPNYGKGPILFTGSKGMEQFDRLMKEEIKKKYEK